MSIVHYKQLSVYLIICRYYTFLSTKNVLKCLQIYVIRSFKVQSHLGVDVNSWIWHCVIGVCGLLKKLLKQQYKHGTSNIYNTND